MEDFNQRLLIIFEKYSLNASSFADTIGVQRSSLSHILSGRNKPSLDFILKIYEAFPEINLAWLTLGEGELTKQKTGTPTSIPQQSDEETKNKMIPEITKDIENEAGYLPIENDFQKNTIPLSSSFDHIKNTSDSNIEQIVIFYTDGTFKTFRSR